MLPPFTYPFDWETLLSRRNHCSEKCGRYSEEINSPRLRGVGNRKAKIVLVGEAPGQLEDEKGVPFVGASGRLLNNTLSKVGLDRGDLYITNAVKCATAGKNRKPTDKEIEFCSRYLKKELSILKPNVVAALGNVPMQALLQRTGITKIKNTVIYSEEFNVKVIPIYHPAYVLRNLTAIQDFERGFAMLKDEGEKATLTVSRKPSKYLVADTKEKVGRVLKKLRAAKVFSFDFETDNLHYFSTPVLCLGVSWKPYFGVVIPWEILKEHFMEELTEIFGSPALKIAHNAKFDISVFRAQGIRVSPPVFDTIVAHHLLDENCGLKGHKLDNLVLQYTDMGEYWLPLEEEKKKIIADRGITKDELTYGMIPRKILYPYGAKDTDGTFRVYKKLKGMLKEQDLYEFFQNHSMPYLWVIQDMEYRGVAVDREKLKGLIEEYTEKQSVLQEAVQQGPEVEAYRKYRLEKVKEEFRNAYRASANLPARFPDIEDYVASRLNSTSKGLAAKLAFNPASPKQLGELFFEIPGRKPIKTTDKGGISTDEEVMNQLAAEGVVMATKLVDLRKVSKYLSTYLVAAYKKSEYDGRLHAEFLQIGTVTGRLSSRNPNMQNIPKDGKDFKECIIADPGYTFVKADLGQAEFRCWAHVSGDLDMIQDIKAGLDIHSRTAAESFGIPEEKFLADRKSKDKKVADAANALRDKAKALVFGPMYGRGSKALAKELGISIEEAEATLETFFGRYPKAARWLKEKVEEARAFGAVRSWLGRIRRLPDIYSDNFGVKSEAERQAMNSPIQALATDLNNFYMVQSLGKAHEAGIDCYACNTVHDANFIQCEESRVSELIGIMNDVVANSVPDFKVPMKLDFEIGKNWGQMEEVKQ